MNARWSVIQPNQVIIERHLPLGSRLFFGVGLSCMAGYFLYYLVRALIEYIRFATAKEWLNSIPGLLISLFIVSIFAVPAWIVLFKKVRVILEMDSGWIRDVSDYLLFKREKRYPLNELARVEIREVTRQTRDSKHGTRSYTSYPVQLVLKSGTAVTVVEEDDVDQAEILGRQLAEKLRVPLEQRLEEEELDSESSSEDVTQTIAVLVLVSLFLTACSKEQASTVVKEQKQQMETGTAQIAQQGFLGLPFYPGSEDKIGVVPDENIPSVRLTTDSVDKVVSFYREKLGTNVNETKVGNAMILSGTTTAGNVDVTVEPFEGQVQVMIARHK